MENVNTLISFVLTLQDTSAAKMAQNKLSDNIRKLKVDYNIPLFLPSISVNF